MPTEFFGLEPPLSVVITHADVVAGVQGVYPLCTCVCVYVSILKQKPLDMSSPNLTGA